MRKTLRFFLLLLVSVVFFCSACGDKQLVAQKTEENTLLIKEDGSIQAAVLEEFDRDYYDIEEAKEFIEQEIEKYNELLGKDSIILDGLEYSDLDEEEDKVCLVLTYKDIETYKTVIGTNITILSLKEAMDKGLIPKTVLSIRTNDEVGRDGLEGEECKVLILPSKFHVMVEGKIKYYTNAAVLNDSEVQTKGKRQKAVIIYQ